MRTLINRLMRLYLLRRWRRLEGEIAQSPQTQTRVWRSHVHKAAQTLWGQQHGFERLRDEAEFKQRVPLGDYESHQPWIARMMQGERDLLWPGETRMFSKSSGTTADKSKFLPVADEAIHHGHISGGHDAVAFWYAQNPETRFFTGKSLIMGGSCTKVLDNPRAIVGDVSALMLANLPAYARFFLAPSLDIAVMSDWEAKIERMAQQVLGERISSISGVPTWSLVLFKRLLELSGKTTIAEVFPQLLMYQHGGVSFKPYRAQFRRLMGEGIAFRETYNASEGFFATQFAEGEESMLLLCNNGVYFEFMPLSEYGQAAPRTLSLQEVEVGPVYALVISTNSGLWRYVIGDTIRFTSVQPPKIQVVGRTKQFINAFGEEVMVENTDTALAQTCTKHKALVNDYSVAPIFLDDAGRGAHQWLIEFEQAPLNLEAFAQDLDLALQALNSDYEAKRYKDMALQRLHLEVLSPGHFRAWLKQKGKLGGQNKVPRLANDRRYVDEILNLKRD